MTLQNQHITLRALEPTDLDFLMQIENDTKLWILSNQQTPWSRYALEQYISNAHQDIYEAKQLRLVIESLEQRQAIGFVDLFDFDPKNKRVGLGICLVEESQNKGFGKQTLLLICKYVFDELLMHQIFVNILTDNNRSLHLFQTFGFELVGIKKDWIYHRHQWHDEALLQLINFK